MIAPRTMLIATLPGRTLANVREEIALVASAGADLAEVRLDRLNPSDLPLLGDLFPAPLPLLATFRSLAEGGLGSNDPVERRAVLERAARSPFAWLDLEQARDAALISEFSRPPVRRVILSTHVAAGGDRSDLARRARESVPEGAIRKIVVHSSIPEWVFDVLPQLPPPGELALIANATGPAGPLSRAWAVRRRSGMVFASVPRSERGGSLLPVEPSQLPLDHLRRFVDGPPTAPLFGVAGRPIARSRSPDIHEGWMAQERRAGLYLPLEFGGDEEFLRCLPALADGGFRGLNVTHPFKAAAFSAASRVERAAEVCGVANCLTFEGGEVEAQNTDLAAILRRLDELRRDGRWSGRSLSVIGAGGAARASLAAARELGIPATVYARRAGGAEAIARAFGARVGDAAGDRPADLLVHATPAGTVGAGPLELELSGLIGPDTHVLDWVYAPEDAVLQRSSEACGASYEDGWRLLVYQAAESYALWWGEPPGAEIVASTIARGP